jgi:hypothetical protein
MALLLGLDKDHGMVAKGAADQSGQERLPIRLFACAQAHKLLSQIPGHHLQKFMKYYCNGT